VSGSYGAGMLRRKDEQQALEQELKIMTDSWADGV
jgi:hypothetical protein